MLLNCQNPERKIRGSIPSLEFHYPDALCLWSLFTFISSFPSFIVPLRTHCIFSQAYVLSHILSSTTTTVSRSYTQGNHLSIDRKSKQSLSRSLSASCYTSIPFPLLQLCYIPQSLAHFFFLRHQKTSGRIWFFIYGDHLEYSF